MLGDERLRALAARRHQLVETLQAEGCRLGDRGLTPRYDFAFQTLSENGYKWREYDAEDTLRFYALRLHDLGLVKSSPQKIISGDTDWRFLNELKRELKA